MKHLTILVPDGQSNLSTVTCIAGAYGIFSEANAYRKRTGKKELFQKTYRHVAPGIPEQYNKRAVTQR
jgi:hypothetical protein